MALKEIGISPLLWPLNYYASSYSVYDVFHHVVAASVGFMSLPDVSPGTRQRKSALKYSTVHACNL